jgi:hypothetical protein
MSDENEVPMLPASCGYQGYEFGAGSYPDSQCFGGRLYDMDKCDGGMIFEPMDYIPCPMCRPKESIARYKQDNLLVMPFRNSRGEPKGYSKRNAARMARSLVRDIRKNRKNGTEPWKVAK